MEVPEDEIHLPVLREIFSRAWKKGRGKIDHIRCQDLCGSWVDLWMGFMRMFQENSWRIIPAGVPACVPRRGRL
ncbi:MAG: hypothetical protein A2018_08295 [Alphaproteobacteria bacterium GWF2_58_20]|nr:MAG: hypothetical protein A2018_08295 [Alphaproteobacteria bacterium GWF2_58_20]